MYCEIYPSLGSNTEEFNLNIPLLRMIYWFICEHLFFTPQRSVQCRKFSSPQQSPYLYQKFPICNRVENIQHYVGIFNLITERQTDFAIHGGPLWNGLMSQRKHYKNRNMLPWEHHIGCQMCQVALSKSAEKLNNNKKNSLRRCFIFCWDILWFFSLLSLLSLL